MGLLVYSESQRDVSSVVFVGNESSALAPAPALAGYAIQYLLDSAQRARPLREREILVEKNVSTAGFAGYRLHGHSQEETLEDDALIALSFNRFRSGK